MPMKSPIFFRPVVLALSLLASASMVSAEVVYMMTGGPGGTVSYTGDRNASLGSADNGYAVGDVTGTPQAADVQNRFGGTWLKEGELTAPGTDDLLTVALNPGSTWGNGPLSGTWAINSLFWSTYGSAVITMHVGNGSGDPDWFFWEVTPQHTSGTFSYERVNGGGGGLSNMFLWGSGKPTQTNVPEAGSTMGLLALALGVASWVRRRIR